MVYSTRLSKILAAQFLRMVAVVHLAFRASLAADIPNAHVWHGFRHVWERRVAGFETPHRFGSFQNAISNESLYLEFTPGVNGDFAFPAAYFADVRAGATAHGKIAFTLEDAIIAENNTARVRHTEPAPVGTTLLSGVSILMKCLTPGVCNSNAVWPTALTVSLDAGAPGGGFVLFELARGYTPSHGGGKPLSARMQYNVTLEYVTLPEAKGVTPIRVEQKGDLHTAPARRSASVDAPAGVLGLTGFGFNLLETGGHKDLGRYLEGLDFSLGDWRYTSGHHNFSWAAGVWAPSATTADSNLLSWLDVTVVHAAGAEAAATQMLNGTVCMDDRAFPYVFRCHAHGLPQQFSTVIPLKYA
ncbi:hypothetical protein CYMTET_48015 [Cymbomonas tetramitiformis]|uniref:Uncharacterized protein n=1 Tax=Cymbomonas tetramitiformis TaxID=36881 RepID=A0AAE0BT25_9CHLO|nr:hypothetical protein CYMTET_48015 [Cymbomonas tetramitiformis]